MTADGRTPTQAVDGSISGVDYSNDVDAEIASLANYALREFTQTGGTNTVIATSAPAVTTLVAGMRALIKATGTNTGAMKLNVDGQGEKAITDREENALVGGEWKAGTHLLLKYDGVRWILLNESPTVLAAQDVALFALNRPNGTDGGDANNGADNILTLNTVDTNNIQGASLDTGTGNVTLASGHYRLDASCAFYGTNTSSIGIWDETASQWVGQSVQVRANQGAVSRAIALVDPTQPNIYSLRYRVETTNTVDGLGTDIPGDRVENYAILEVTQYIPYSSESTEFDAIGVNTVADSSNKLAVRSESALFTNITDGEGGTGDVRIYLNKEADADTASILLQRDFSGRAEFGLTGDNDLSFKVSADGSTWLDALKLDSATGNVLFQQVIQLKGYASSLYPTAVAGGMIWDTDTDEVKYSDGSSWISFSTGGSGGGSSVALDLGADGNDSSGITKIQTIGDINNIVTEVSANVMQLDMSQTWPASATVLDGGISVSAKLGNDIVDNTKLANMPGDTMKGRLTGTGDPQDLTPVQIRGMINVEDGATADQTDAEIKVAYENNANTNAYTDAEQVKVGHILVTQAVDLDQLETDVAALANGMNFEDDWDASAGTYPGGGAAQRGEFYYVTTGGTVDGIEFAIGDALVARTDNASTTTYASNWRKLDATDAVTAVAGLTGSITDSALRAAINIENGATADQTGSEIKALYEAEADTNSFTDAEQSKLAAIEAAATADQTGAEIKALYEAENDTNALSDANKAKLDNISVSGAVNLDSDFQPLNTKLTELSDLSPTSQGVLFFNASGQVGRLDKGADGQVLKVIAGALAWDNESGGGGGGGTTVTVTQQSILMEVAVAQGTLAGSVSGATQAGII